MNAESRDEEMHKRNVETFARRFAAKEIAGVDGSEYDPWGQKLPKDVWEQFIPQAERALSFEVKHRSFGYGHETVEGTCPLDATVEEVKERFYHEYLGGRGAWVKDGRFGCTIHND
jgi:hypothetical protein